MIPTQSKNAMWDAKMRCSDDEDVDALPQVEAEVASGPSPTCRSDPSCGDIGC